MHHRKQRRKMTQVSIKFAICIIISSILLLVVYNLGKCDGSRWTVDGSPSPAQSPLGGPVRFQQRETQSLKHKIGSSSQKYREIECVVNNDFSIKCRKDAEDVFMPFAFIRRYFEVHGSLNSYDGYERFDFQHTHLQIYPQPRDYSPSGPFMSFESYNVEKRQRVKCISAIHGVPVSLQWNPRGHYYPIQIAQFGLSHYSKHLTEPDPMTLTLEDGEGGDLNKWLLSDRRSQIVIRTDKNNEHNNVIEFDTSESMKKSGITLSVSDKNLRTLSFDVKFINNGSISVSLQSDEGNIFHIHYILSDVMVTVQDKEIFYGLGKHKNNTWIHVTRKILTDFDKGRSIYMSKRKKLKLKSSQYKIMSVSFRGHGFVDNVTVSSAAHMDHFLDAANYFVHQQDAKGGWPIQVKRTVVPGELTLNPGWYSAMGQGHAMSLLVRAFNVTKDIKYLEAASKALHVFDIPCKDGGVLSKFAGVYDWYEEYPTNPGTYVLNGFIYSLLGLYDLKQTVVLNSTVHSHAQRLYDTGLQTLKKMLLMFDTGTGTLYDLKHIELGVAPNRARWDYHAVHIYQLFLLSVLDKDPLFHKTAERWVGYLKGKMSPHN